MNKAELVAGLEGRLGSKKAATDAVEGVFDLIIREVAAGRKVGITGFGTFEKINRAARTGRNPRTGETVRIKQTAVPKFKPGGAFKTGVASPKSLPKSGNAGGRASATATSTTAAKSTTKNATAKKSSAKKATSAAKTTAAKRTSAAKGAASKSATTKSTAAKSAKKTPSRRTAKS